MKSREVRDLGKIKQLAAFRLLAAVLSASLLLCGCAIHGSQIRRTSEGFLKALADADAEAAAEYASEDVLQMQELLFLYPDAFEESLYEELWAQYGQTARKNLSPEAQAAIREYVEVLSERSILEYSTKEITEKDRVGTIRAVITFGYTPDHEELFDSSGNAAEEIEAYKNEHREELLAIYSEQGEEAMNRRIFNDVIVIMANSMKQAVESADPHTSEVLMTVEEVDGRWIVTDIRKNVTEEENDNSDEKADD